MDSISYLIHGKETVHTQTESRNLLKHEMDRNLKVLNDAEGIECEESSSSRELRSSLSLLRSHPPYQGGEMNVDGDL